MPGSAPERSPRWLVSPDARESKHESRRTTAALALLVGVSFLLLNAAIYHGTRSHLVSERWSQLVIDTDEKRQAMRGLLIELRREAELVANQDEFRRWLEAPGSGDPSTLSARQSMEFQRELDQAAASLDLLGIELLNADGEVFSNTSHGSLWRTEGGMALARRASETKRPQFMAEHSSSNGKPLVLVAVPIAARRGPSRAPVAVLYAGLDERVSPVLRDWEFPGRGGGAFLVLRDGRDAVIVTTPPRGSHLSLDQRVSLMDRSVRVVTMAAEGVEGQIESEGPNGHATWAVVRNVPELGCGLVGQADREVLFTGIGKALMVLLAFDLGVIVLSTLLIGLWRRHDRARNVEREIELTRRHARGIQAVLDNAFDAILSLASDGRVVTANRAAERLFGQTAAELAGRPLNRLLRASARKAAVRPASDASPVSRGEALRPEGPSVPVEFSLARSPDGGPEAFTTLVVRDMSSRVEAEKQIDAFAKGLEVSNRRLEEANHQLEQASRLKSEFLANTSHELRTPLNGIMGFLQLVLDGMCDTEEERREFLVQALQCSKHLLGLINDVLDIAKIEAGRLLLAMEPVDIAPLFEEVLTVTHVQAQQKGLRIVFEPPPPDLPRVRADSGKLKQVLINLVGNSLKFTHQGSITIRAQAQLEAGHCMIEVIDTGIGVEPDRQRLIFDKFIQADGTTTRRYGGTGLGLAITRSLVELMGGVIGIDSQGAGKGTRMYFSVPIWRGEEDLQTPSESGESVLPDLISGPVGGPLVLVVDDDSVFRRFATAVLQQNGYRTAEAAHAEAGWVLVRRLRPALVVLDYALSCPEGSLLRTGWDLAERMASDARTRHIPFVFATGFEPQLRGKLDGVEFVRRPRHLMKPVEADSLMAQIGEALGDTPGRVIRVLLADDDPTVAAYVGKVLPADRFQVEVVNNGEECLHLLRTQPRGFDLLLLDLMMPELSGYEVLRDMALTGTGAGLPVIVLTNAPEPRNESERRLLEQGLVLDLLSKSSIHEEPGLLARAIDQNLESLEATRDTYDGPKLEVERFRAELPEGDASDELARLGVERFAPAPRRDRNISGVAESSTPRPPVEDEDDLWRVA